MSDNPYGEMREKMAAEDRRRSEEMRRQMTEDAAGIERAAEAERAGQRANVAKLAAKERRNRPSD